jgi:hypothetical protein
MHKTLIHGNSFCNQVDQLFRRLRFTHTSGE